MRRIARAAVGVLMLTGTIFAMTSPASAYVGIEFGFGGPGFAFGDPCDYYDYYDAPPPWGLPPDYCDYPVYFEPVFFDGTWYRGPIYYRWTRGRRMFWLHGGWRADAWRGPRLPSIDWQTRGGINHGFRPGMNFRHGFRGGPLPWNGSGPPWMGGHVPAGPGPWSGHGHGGFGGNRGPR
jgi:hypothetical protein